jgi:hypothetical protein
VAFICKGGVLLGSPLWGQRLWGIDLIVDGRRKARSQGDVFASYVVLDDATADILSVI